MCIRKAREQDLDCCTISARGDVNSDFAVLVLMKRKGNFYACPDG